MDIIAQKEGTASTLPSLATEPEFPEALPPRDRQVMLRYIEGQSKGDIATALYVEPAAITRILAKPQVREEIARLMALDSNRVFETRVAGLADEALDVARETMRGKQLSEMRWKAAKDLLDRHPSQRRETAQAQRGGSAAMGDAIIKRLAEMQAKALGVLPEADTEADIVIEKEAEPWTTDLKTSDQNTNT